MSDTAAFFAKKKKKKGFKGFNANLIDAKSVTSTIHVDAPALSTDAAADPTAPAPPAPAVPEAAAPVVATEPAAPAPAESTGEWDDEALAASYARRGTVTAAATSELMDMKALEIKRREQDDVAERMRVEETKAALAAAREGMEREAQRLKEEAEKKKEEAAESQFKTVGRGGGGGGGGRGRGMGGKWVPPHLRAAAGGGLSRMRMGAAAALPGQKLDTKDENLFPDLAAADAILEQQKTQVAYKVPKKTPVGGGATWGSRPKPTAKQQSKPEPPPEKPVAEEKPKLEPPKEEPAAAAAAAPAPAPGPAAAPASAPAPAPVKKKKKKKKDLSTFKPT